MFIFGPCVFNQILSILLHRDEIFASKKNAYIAYNNESRVDSTKTFHFSAKLTKWLCDLTGMSTYSLLLRVLQCGGVEVLDNVLD